jgi:predicted GIY-YIG superfamily endonuclease
MVHWVYILRCDGEIEEWTSKGMNDKIYVGETLRLYRRLKEHVDSDRKGSCTTSEFYPNRLIGLYKVEDDLLYIDHENDIYKKMYEEGYLDKLENKTDALNLENTITEMYMQSMGPKWENVYGGKYHNGYRPIDNPSVSVKFNRPYCNCKIPADIKERNGKFFWRCSKKNIWSGLQEYIKELGLNLQSIVEPCKYYKEYKEREEFKCENLIYNAPINKLPGKCLILSDSDDE